MTLLRKAAGGCIVSEEWRSTSPLAWSGEHVHPWLKRFSRASWRSLTPDWDAWAEQVPGTNQQHYEGPSKLLCGSA